MVPFLKFVVYRPVNRQPDCIQGRSPQILQKVEGGEEPSRGRKLKKIERKRAAPRMQRNLQNINIKPLRAEGGKTSSKIPKRLNTSL